MNRQQYSEYLQSDHWKDLKLRKSLRVKLCFICRQKPDAENYHHFRYRNIYDVSMHDIRLACEDCHNFYHALKKEHPNWPEKKILKHVRAMKRAVTNI